VPSETLVGLLVFNPSGVTWNGLRRGAGTMRCRPRWGLAKLHTRRFLGAHAPGFTIPPHFGGYKTNTSVNGTRMIGLAVQAQPFISPDTPHQRDMNTVAERV
jgi:hypothetical protein